MPNAIPIATNCLNTHRALLALPIPSRSSAVSQAGIQGYGCLESTVAPILLRSLPLPSAASIPPLLTSG